MAQAKQFTLLLLYDKVASSLPVVQALKEKDIDVSVVQNAGELIQAIAMRKTDMVGLSVNHTSTPSLIRVLKEKTQVSIMVFGEDKQPQTGKKIDKAEVDLKISGVANGYNIFMKIGHLVKKKEKESEHARSILLTGGGEKTVSNSKKKKAGSFIVKGKIKDKKEKDDEGVSAVTHIKSASGNGGGDLNDEDSLAQQLEAAQKKQAGETLIFEDGIKQGTGAIKERGEVKKGAGALIFRKKEKDDAKKAGRLIKKAGDDDNGKVKEKAKPHPLGVGGTIVFSDEALAQQKKFEKQEAKDVDPGNVEALDEGVASTHTGAVQTPDMVDEDKSIGNVIDFQARKKKADEAKAEPPPVEESPEKKYEKYRKEKAAKVPPPPPLHPMDVLRNKKQFKDAVKRAGEKSFKKSSEGADFEKVSKVCIVPVINPRERGFLLFCASDDQFLSAEGLSNFKLNLLSEMKDQAVGDFILGDVFNVQTFETNISDWAMAHSQFSCGFEEDGKQIFVSFVKRETVYPEFKMMDEPAGVYRVHIHTMPPLTPVDFNVFLYFMKNKRLIPYLKKGGKFTQRQIQRLYKRGFKFLYISVDERNEFLNFYITLMINQDFQSTVQRKLA